MSLHLKQPTTTDKIHSQQETDPQADKNNLTYIILTNPNHKATAILGHKTVHRLVTSVTRQLAITLAYSHNLNPALVIQVDTRAVTIKIAFNLIGQLPYTFVAVTKTVGKATGIDRGGESRADETNGITEALESTVEGRVGKVHGFRDRRVDCTVDVAALKGKGR
jgi:hypothetical protein